ncbi:small secreted hydrophilic protein [Streptomyces sp. DSM 118878]
MVFSQRMAALAAVVAIPLGIAVTSYLLTDSPAPPKAPPKVELPSGSPSATPTTARPTPSDEKVPPPPVGENGSDDDGPSGDDGPTGDDNDDADDDAGRGDNDDDGPGDDG